MDYSSNNNLLQDGLITGSVSNDTYLKSTSINNTFLNVTYNLSKEYVESGSQIIRKWYYQTLVNDSSGNLINNANVTAYDSIGRQDFRATTNSSGLISPTGITEYVNTGSASGINRTYSSNYVIAATNGPRYGRNDSYNVSLYLNKLDNVITLDSINPNVTILSPLNAGGYNNVSISFNVTTSETANGTGMIVPNLDNSLLSWWRMDDVNSSGDVVDYMGRNNGTHVGNVAQVDNGKFGKAFAFDGDGDYVQFAANQGPISGIGPFSLIAWIKTFSGGTPYIIQQRDVGGVDGEYVLQLSSGTVNYWDYNGGYGYNFASTKTVNDNSWHMVSFTRNSTHGSIYIDGLVNATSAVSPKSLSSSLDLCIGADFRDKISFFNGSIDEVMVFNKSLSSDEIAALYNATRISHTETLTQGSHSYNAYVQDLAGNVVNSGVNNFIIDMTFPQVAFDSSSTNGTVNITNLFMNLTTSDDNGQHFAFVDDGALRAWWRMDDAGRELTVNGNAESGQKGPWTMFTGVESNDTHSGNYAFYLRNAYSGAASTTFMPIDVNSSYNLSGWFRSNGSAGNSIIYYGFVPYDKNYQQIAVYQVNPVVGTDTTLYEDVVSTSKFIKLTNGTNWYNLSYGYVAFNTDDSGRYNDLPNRNLSNSGISVYNNGSYWVVNFSTTVGVNAAAGTKIRMQIDGGNYMYSAASYATVPNSSWTQYSAVVRGESLYGGAATSWWRGTKYAKVLALFNYGQYSDSYVLLADDLSVVGPDIYDYTANDNNVVVYGNATQTDSGEFGHGFSFDGSGDYALASGTLSQPSTVGNMSCSGWINLNQKATVKGGHNAFFCGLYQHTANNYLYIYGNNPYGTSLGSVNINEWHHLVVNFVNARTNESEIYLDGVKSSFVGSEAINANANSSVIGQMSAALTSSSLNGSLDEVMVWNRSLSAAEVLSLYNASVNQYRNNFSVIASRSYNYTGYAVDWVGNVNFTAPRSVTVLDIVSPSVEFASSSTLNKTANSWAFMNLTTSETTGQHAAFVDDGSLVGWWRMDDVNSSGNPTDYFGRNNWTLIGPGATFIAGKFGNAYNSTGNTSLKINSNNAFDPMSHDLSFSLWANIRFDKNLVYPGVRLIAKRNYNNAYSGWSLLAGNSSTNYFDFYLYNGSDGAIGTPIGLRYNLPSTFLGGWHQIVGVINRTGNMTLYVDNVSVGTSSILTFSGQIINLSLIHI